MINLINAAIKLNDEKGNNVELIASRDKFSANKALKTIHINCGRGTGKTHSMMQLARENDLIIVRLETIRKQLKVDYPNCLSDIMSYGSFSLNTWGCKPSMRLHYDRVWLDEIGFLEESYGSDREYYRLNANLFIKLGE